MFSKGRAVTIAVWVALAAGVFSASPVAFALTEVPGSEKQQIYQVADEIEPTLISYTHFGVEYSVSVWMDFNPNIDAPSTLKFTAWTSTGLTNSGGSIPAVTGYSRYADPVLVKNPTSTRIYLVALAQQQTLTTEEPIQIDTLDSALIVWYSDNAGWNWSSGYVFATERWTLSTGDSFDALLDKPVPATGPDGRLWVTHTRRVGAALFNMASWVQTETGTNTGSSWSFTGRTTISTNQGAQAPLIVVDSDNDAYILYTRSGGLSFWWDDAQDGQGWLQLTTPTVGTLIQGGTLAVGSVNIRAISVPAAKLDSTRRRITAVWHERNPVSGTQLRMAVFRLDTRTWSSQVFAAGNGINHVNVGMDFDTTNGNVVVTWYRFGFQSSTYVNVGKYVTFNASHTPSWVSDDQITSRLGDAANLTADAQGTRHIGEYHDVSYTNGKFKAVHLIAVAPWSDPWVFTVQQP
jgi:hypothetical protein